MNRYGVCKIKTKNSVKLVFAFALATSIVMAGWYTASDANNSSPIEKRADSSPERIAFTEEIKGTSQIFTVDIDGKSKRMETQSNYDKSISTLTRDNRHIVFKGYKPNERFYSQFGFYVLDRQTGSERRLTDGLVWEGPYDCHPGNDLIVFEGIYQHHGYGDIVIATFGGKTQKLTNTEEFDERAPSFDHDGTQIIYVSNALSKKVDGYRLKSVFTMRLDGTDRKRLTFDESEDCEKPTMSPDGTHIAFVSRKYDEKTEIQERCIVLLNLSTQKRRILTKNERNFFQPQFSLDGRSIVYGEGGETPLKTFLFSLEDRVKIPLDPPESNKTDGARFTADGKHIVFWAYFNKTRTATLMRTDSQGKNRVALTSKGFTPKK